MGDVMKKNEILELQEGSKYQITSLGSKDAPIVSTGKFVGYGAMGNADAICLELDKSHKKLAGKIRMIPSHMVMTLDIITEKKEKSKPDEDSMERSYI
jgi:hypothetical protein